MKTNSNRFYFLDYTRFFLAFSVMIYHYCFRGGVKGDRINLTFPEFEDITRYGFLGVQAFFIISGFVISLSANGKKPKEFLKSRALRLLPAFWVCCTLTFIVMSIGSSEFWKVSLFAYIRNMLFIEGFVFRNYVDGVYWSLTIELIFYFYIFILIFFNVFKKNSLKFFIFVWLSLSLTGYFFEISNSLLFRMLILNYAPYFSLGIIAYLYIGKKIDLFFFLSLIISLAASYLELSHKAFFLSSRFGIYFDELLMFYSVIFFYFIFCCLVFFNPTPTKYLINLGTILGGMSYALYLIHQNIGYEIMNQLNNLIPNYINLTLTTAIIIIASYFIFIVAEPTINRKLYFAINLKKNKSC